MKNVLIIQTASLGDVVLSTALCETLHRDHPEILIDLLVKKGNEGLFEGHPYLHRVLAWDKRKAKYRGLLELAGRIRANRYDLVVNVQRFASSGFLAVASAAGETRGFGKNPLSFLFSRKIGHRIGDGTHETARNHRLIEDLALSGPARPRLYPGKADREVAASQVRGSFCTFSPGSLWATKQYPADRWAELARRLPAGFSVALLGSPADRQLCDEVARLALPRETINLAGRMTLLQSAALMESAVMNYTNDSAPMHLASSVNAPVTAIFCSTVPGFGFGPLSDDSMVAETGEPLACRPCGLHGLPACPEKHFRCAYGISIESLASRADRPA